MRRPFRLNRFAPLSGIAAAACLLAAAACAQNLSSPMTSPAPAGPPVANVDDVVDTLYGHRIADPYRWLEDGGSPATQAWVGAEMAYTRGLLDALPGRAAIRARLEHLVAVGNITAPQPAGNYYFYTRRDGLQNQPVLYVRTSAAGPDRVLVDVNPLSADGTVALDWWYPSDDGQYVAYGLSSSGSEESTLHLIETATGRALPDQIPGTRYASVAWKKDNSGFYYTRHPAKGEVPPGEEVYHVKVFYHVLGADPTKDELIFGAGRNPQDVPDVQLADDDDRWLLITEEEGWTKTELYLQDLQAGTAPVEITSGKDFLYQGEIFQGKLYLYTNEDAPHFRVLVTDAARPQRANWREIIPPAEAVLQGVSVCGGRLLAQYEHNVTSRLNLFALDGSPLGEIPLPALGAVEDIGGKWNVPQAFFGFESFTIPPSVYAVDLATRQTGLWGKVDAPVDSSAYAVDQVWYKSKDGTSVPMFLVYKKGLVRNGHNPTLLAGYGGFNVSNTPYFNGGRYVWLEHGGVYAVANIRGGSEFGEDWHRAGMLDKKQNVFDDFYAAAQYLMETGYTDSRHLAIIGGSNGGLLVGAAITQRPELYRAAICLVPLLDMLRYQNFQIAKLWVPEYGSADDPKQFDWLYAYSPYHHVRPGVEYPAVLFMTSDTDKRVDPMHARKMAALMQAQAANGRSADRPILLRVETKAGHGQGMPVAKQIEESTDIYSFLFWQLGVTP
jgi:prolyl oligopeptidase